MFSGMRFGAVLALLPFLGAAASGDALRDGTTAFASNDYATAMRLLAPLAQTGNPPAECMVTVMHDERNGGALYDAEAMRANCIAAADGDAVAQLDLAGHYRTGMILQRDAVKAAQLYRLAAEQGLPIAQKVLGDLYAEGTGVARDFAAACRWWGRAAMQGRIAEAQRNFGDCYLAGDGVPQSASQALAWWLVAQSNEDKNTDGLPSWVFQRQAEADRATHALMERLPADQVALAQAFALGWEPKRE